MDIALDGSGDIDLTGDTMRLVDGDDAIRQQLTIRYQFVKGEWQNDTRVGIPYFEDVWIKNPDFNIIRGLFRQATVTCPGIDTIRTLGINVDGKTRRATISLVALKKDGAVLTYDTEFILS